MKNFRLRLFIILVSLSASSAFGAWTRYLPKQTAGQKQVLQLISEGNYTDALAIWPQHMAGVRGTAEGQAALQLLVFKAGFPDLALENLFKIKGVGTISRDLRQEWQKSANPKHPAWTVVDVDWTKPTRQLFPQVAGSKSLAYPVYIVSNTNTLSKARRGLEYTSGTYDKHQLGFRENQLGLWEAIFDRTSTSLALMDKGDEGNIEGLDSNRVFLNRARVLYQRGKFNEALMAYEQVQKGSDYWIEAVEEKAYTYLKQNRPEQTLAQLENIINPVFANQVGPEPFFLAAFTNLKICAYPQIFRVIKNFKQTFKERLPHLQKLAKTGGTAEADEAIFRLVKGPYSLQSLGPQIASLPRNFHRDLYIRHNVDRRRAFLKQFAQASDYISAGHGNVGNSLLDSSRIRAEEARTNIFKRLKFLAEQDIAEFKQILQKMQIIEAEVIQRVHMAEKLAKKGEKRESDVPTSAKDKLSFPSSDEVWMDEFDGYQVSIKDCPPVGRMTR